MPLSRMMLLQSARRKHRPKGITPLEDGIVQAAYSEFLTYGFQKASLHKIADKAGVATGAIYTRYKNKDALFGSLLFRIF